MSNDLIARLRAYAADQIAAFDDTAAFGFSRPCSGVRYIRFAYFDLNFDPPIVELACEKTQFARFQQTNAAITVSKKKQWDRPAWLWASVPLNGDVPEPLIQELIDHAYQVIVKFELQEIERRVMALRERQPNGEEALFALTHLLELDHRRTEIRALVRPAINLVTSRTDESQLSLGQSKIGGHPDMPVGAEWPKWNGHALGFLAQINLAEISETVDRGPLPNTGLLLFFSILGRTESFESFWELEDMSDDGFSQVIYVSAESLLERLETPVDVTSWQACSVRFHEFMTLPWSDKWTRDPVLEQYAWLETEFENLTTLAEELSYVMRVPFGHRLLGYAAPIQSAVTTLGERLMFVVDSDYDNAGMMWGDGGQIYFIIGEDALQRGDFSHVRADMQSG